MHICAPCGYLLVTVRALHCSMSALSGESIEPPMVSSAVSPSLPICGGNDGRAHSSGSTDRTSASCGEAPITKCLASLAANRERSTSFQPFSILVALPAAMASPLPQMAFMQELPMVLSVLLTGPSSGSLMPLCVRYVYVYSYEYFRWKIKLKVGKGG